jgi:hypothetical protein
VRDINLFQLALGLVPLWKVAAAAFAAGKMRIDVEIDLNGRQ